MSFSADWLATRRAADARARNPEIAARLKAHFADKQSCQVLDLGCGTGANLEATSPMLPEGQHWTMVDNDPALLSQITPADGIQHRPVEANLASDLDQLFDPKPDLVTASALFDLAGRDFIDDLAQHCVRAGAAFFTVLTYDGEESWSPPQPQDEAVLSAFHADQHAEKGLGPALGPDATDYLKATFTQAGYELHVGKSDWTLSQAVDANLMRMLAEGIHRATQPSLHNVADDWLTARLSAEQVRVGHIDLIAVPRSTANGAAR